MPMDLNRFTEKAAQAFLAAQKEAQERHHGQVEPLHLLTALLGQSDGVVPQVVQKLGASTPQLSAAVQDELARLPQAHGPTQVYLSPQAEQVGRIAEEEAGRMRDEYVSTEHLLLGLTDGQGRTVDFKNAVVIMTSNVGSTYLQDLRKGQEEEIRRRVMEALRGQFRPEFLNRVDEVVIFNPLGLEEIRQIVEIQLRRVQERLRERKLELEWTAAARAHLAEVGFDPAYGARPLKRAIQREVLDPLALKVLEGHFREGDIVVVDAVAAAIAFRRKGEDRRPPQG